MLTIDVDRQAAGRYGIPVGEILEMVDSLGTRKVGQVIDGQRRFDLVLRLGDDARSSAERIGQVLIRTEGGAQVPLSSVAEITVVEGSSTIKREWAKRRVVIQANVRGRDVGSFVEDVRQTRLRASRRRNRPSCQPGPALSLRSLRQRAETAFAVTARDLCEFAAETIVSVTGRIEACEHWQIQEEAPVTVLPRNRSDRRSCELVAALL